MRAMFSYASILHAVGQLLDQVGVSSFGFNSDGQLQVQVRYDVASLYDLLCRSEVQVAEQSERVAAEDEGTLHRFLADHNRELVGAIR